MSRPPRAAEGGLIYHALNRANAGLAIFGDEGDYDAFLGVLNEATTRTEMRLLAFCLMPNHFHLVVWPVGDGDLSRFMRWLTMTHTQRWHAHRKSSGSGHLYQGRFKSFPVQDDGHLVTVCRYVERNALKAGLVTKAEDWRWGSLAKNQSKRQPPGPTLTPWPIERPKSWTRRVNEPLSPVEQEALQRAIRRGQPFGSENWQVSTASRLELESTLRPQGRPRKSPINGS